MVKKKKKDTFKEFRSNEKSAYTTIKTTLKSVLHNYREPVLFKYSITNSNRVTQQSFYYYYAINDWIMYHLDNVSGNLMISRTNDLTSHVVYHVNDVIY